MGAAGKSLQQPDKLSGFPDFFLEWLAREFLTHLLSPKIACPLRLAALFQSGLRGNAALPVIDYTFP